MKIKNKTKKAKNKYTFKCRQQKCLFSFETEFEF